ncbi:MAG: hypothetical protein ACR2LR_09215 [Hassallia sp.]
MKLYHKKLVKAIALIDWRKSDRELLAYANFKTVDFPARCNI